MPFSALSALFAVSFRAFCLPAGAGACYNAETAILFSPQGKRAANVLEQHAWEAPVRLRADAWAACLAGALLLVPTWLHGQSGATTGEIRGTITDASKAVIPGAMLTATHVHTGLSRTTTSDEDGAYLFALLPPGMYEVKAQHAGFSTVTQKELILEVGQFLVVDFTLQVAAVPQEVSVTGVSPVVETLRTQQAYTVTQRSINDLPINGRNFLEFTLLMPGVVEANPTVPLLKQLPSTGLSFAGQNGRGNVVTIDGADNMDDASNSVRATPSQEAVLEYQVNSNGYLAEFGRAAAGAINIVTKSGTNDWHGNLFLFHRNQSIQARNFFAGEKPKFHRNQPGFTLGGPLRRDQSFVFLSYEALLQREPVFVNILGNPAILRPTPGQAPLFDFLKRVPPPVLQNAGINPALPILFDLTPTSPVPPARNAYNLLADLHGARPFKLTRNVGSFKLDRRFGSSDSLVLRHIWSHEKSFGNFVGGLLALSRGTFNTFQDNSLVVGHTHLISPTVINEFRFQFARRVFNVDAIDRFGPAVNIQGVAEFGRDFNLDSDRIERRLQWTDNVTRNVGRHTLKFGADVNYIWFDTRTPIFFGGSFDFQNPGNALPLGLALNVAGTLPVPPDSPLARLDGVTRIGALLTALGQTALIPTVLQGPATQPLTSLQMFVLGLPLVYNQGFGNPRDAFSNTQLGFFFQDGIRVGRRLNLNLGLRYDVELQPQPMHRDTNNFGPRFGFSYDVWGNGRTLLRGGYGIFYQPLYQAVAFASRVLNGENIVNVVRTLGDDLAGRAGSAVLWQYANQQGLIGRRTLAGEDLARFGLAPGRDSLVVQGVTSNLVNPYSHQASFGIEQQLPGEISAEVNYNLVRGLKIVRNNISNVRAVGTRIIPVGGQTLNFGPIFAPIDPTILAKFLIGTEASSIYHGMTARVSKRFSRHYQFLGSYTRGKAIDDATDINQSLAPQNPLNARDERSLSAFDVRHRLAISAVLESPFQKAALRDFTLSPIATYRSGYPFNLLLGVDPGTGNFNGVNTQRPAGAGRNTGRGPDFYSFDLRLARKFRVGERWSFDWIMEGFNLLNRANFKSVNRTVGSFLFPFPTFRVSGIKGRPSTDFLGFTEAFNSRQFQLALKINF